jgi:hypothetical protein
MPPTSFNELEEALSFVVERLVSNRHHYIINVRGPKEIAKNHASTVQVVAENMVYENGEFGLTIHLPFDPASGTFQQLADFLGTDIAAICDEYNLSGIPCFGLRAGVDVLMAEKALRFILLHVYGYKNLTDFEVEVHDEGPVNREEV